MAVQQDLAALKERLMRTDRNQTVTNGDLLNVVNMLLALSSSISTPTLQQVTDVGAITTNNITVNTISCGDGNPVGPITTVIDNTPIIPDRTIYVTVNGIVIKFLGQVSS